MPDVLILAAGHGTRLRPLTDTLPKPLLSVGGMPLVEHHLWRLRARGFRSVVINLGWRGEQIREHLGDGRRFGLSIRYSHEPQHTLGTGGGITHALKLLRGDWFVVINGDIISGFDYAGLEMAAGSSMHLVMVPNPAHHPHGDFAVADGRLCAETAARARLTYAGIGCFRRCLFAGWAAHYPPHAFPLRPLIRRAAAAGAAAAEVYRGLWMDVGSPQRLAAAQRYFRQNVP